MREVTIGGNQELLSISFSPLKRSFTWGLSKPSVAAAPLERRKEIHNIYKFPPQGKKMSPLGYRKTTICTRNFYEIYI